MLHKHGLDRPQYLALGRALKISTALGNGGLARHGVPEPRQGGSQTRVREKSG